MSRVAKNLYVHAPEFFRIKTSLSAILEKYATPYKLVSYYH